MSDLRTFQAADLLLTKWEEALEKISRNLTFPIVSYVSTCGSGHPQIVLDTEMDRLGGLVVTHLDGLQGSGGDNEMMSLVTAEFLNALYDFGFFDDLFLSYAEVQVKPDYAGKIIEITGTSHKPIHWDVEAKTLQYAA